MVRVAATLIMTCQLSLIAGEPAAMNDPVPQEKIDQIIQQLSTGSTQKETAWAKIFSQKTESRLADFCFSPNSKNLAWCDLEGNVKAWDLASGKQLGAFKATGSKLKLAITPDGKHVIVGGDFQAAQVWELKSGKKVFAHDAFRDTVTFLAVSTDGSHMLGADAKGFFHKYPLLGGQGVSVDLDPGNESPMAAIAVSADASRILYTFATGETTLLRLNVSRSAKPVPGKPIRLGGKLDGGNLAAFGTRVFATATGTTAKVAFPLEEGSVSIQQRKFSLTNLDQISVSPDDRLFAGVTSHGQIQIFDPREPSVAIQIAPPLKGPVTGRGTTRLSPDCQSVAILHERYLQVWRIAQTSLSDQKQVREIVTQMLDAKQYQQLSKVIRTVTETDEDLFSELLNFLWPSGDTPIIAQREQAVVAWHEAVPNELLPRLIMARREKMRAWEIRGNGYANSVTDKQWEGYYKHIDSAVEFLDDFTPDESTPGQYYLERISLHTARGSEYDDFFRTVSLLLKHRPEYMPAHVVAVRHLMPRWHGAPGQSAFYADLVARQVGGDKGEALYVSMAESLLPYHHTENYIQITQFDYKRIRKWLSEKLKVAADVRQKDYLTGLLMCFARRAADKETAQQNLAKVIIGGWMARNKSNSKRYSDVMRTVIWLKSEGNGRISLPKGTLKGMLPPLPK